VNLTFVISTGRAGSTLISRILHEHPDVLSVSEFFAALMGVLRRLPYPDHDMDGEELWRIVAKQDHIADALVQNGMQTPEMFYPYGRGRFTPEAGIPVICHSTLSLLSDDPDTLFDQLAAEVPGWPRRTAADQYRALFARLAAMLGRRVVVERSGGSLVEIETLRREFPEARLVHMYRDGPDCALSMSRFPMFQLGIVTYRAAQEAGIGLQASWDEVMAVLPEEYAGLLTPPYDFSRLAEFEFDPLFFGGMWSEMMKYGVRILSGVPTGQWDTLGYADLLRDPVTELTRLADFIGVAATPQWLAAAGHLIDPGQQGKAAALDPKTLTALRKACEPGEAALKTQAKLRAAGPAGQSSPGSPAASIPAPRRPVTPPGHSGNREHARPSGHGAQHREPSSSARAASSPHRQG
jgi:hypothetical protein